MRRLNIEIKYLLEHRNKIANALLRTLFNNKACGETLQVEKASRRLASLRLK